MATLLHVSASPRGGESLSRDAAARAIQYWQQQCPELSTVERDLAASPLPHPDAGFVKASLSPVEIRTEEQQARLQLSEALIEELLSAAAILISMPMHNFSVPSSLKAWIDHVVRPGRTFQATPDGKLGLMSDRPVRVIMSCGGRVTPPGQQDWATPYLRYLFAVIGIRDFQAFILEQSRRGDASLALSKQQLENWMAGSLVAIRQSGTA